MAEIAKADMTLFQNRFIGDGQAEQTATEIIKTSLFYSLHIFCTFC